MSILVVGSVAFDTVTTPFGQAAEVLGGSATYFAAAASFFTDVRMVTVVGKDFPEEHLDFLRKRNVDLRGLQREVPSQVRRPALIAADTMNYWIKGKPDSLRQTLAMVDMLVINEAETRQLAGEPNLVHAAQKVRALGPRAVGKIG